MDRLLVMKFGGTSVGSAERIEGAADLIAASARVRPTVAVVSAMSKVTDLLLDTLQKAENGDEAGLEANLLALRDKHLETCHKLLPAEAQSFVTQRIQELISGFERIARGMLLLGERPLRSVDQAVATGERLSALLVSAVLESRGVAAEAVDAAEAIVTDDDFGSASPLMEETTEKARGRLLPALKAGRIPIVTGFNGATRDGRPTTLGRGGSDFSGAILAAALDAEEVWIWTDVDGILSADPRVVADTRVLPEVTYNEAAELAYNGAKVLHPRTLAPLAERRIPVWIKNSFDPSKPGTRIVAQITDGHGVRAITSLGQVALISIEAASPSMSGAQLMARSLEAAARAGVEVLLLTRSSFRQNFCMLVRLEELRDLMESLRDDLALELAHGYVHPIDVDQSVGLLAVVGEGMRGTPGLAGRVFSAISSQSINIIAIAQGSSELTIAIVVKQDALDAAVRVLHSECKLGVRRPAPVKVS
jgi:aspartate kinase